jgi:CheY-like chemotaxis protein
LSTTTAIVRSHGGFINVYSEEHKGTTFKVFLPAIPSEAIQTHKILDVSNLLKGSGECVLVVDDEEAIRKIAQHTLNRFGYRVMLASDGSEALEIYKKNQDDIDLVLTDMAMPVMDGPTTIAALKKINPAVKIIASSGFSSSTDPGKLPGSGVECLVPKPYTAEMLLKALHQALKSPDMDHQGT